MKKIIIKIPLKINKCQKSAHDKSSNGVMNRMGERDSSRVGIRLSTRRVSPTARGTATRHAGRAARRGTVDVRSAPMPDYFDHVRRATRRLDWNGLEVGGEEPVRVELEVPEALYDPAAEAARLATDLSSLRDVVC